MDLISNWGYLIRSMSQEYSAFQLYSNVALRFVIKMTYLFATILPAFAALVIGYSQFKGILEEWKDKDKDYPYFVKLFVDGFKLLCAEIVPEIGVIVAAWLVGKVIKIGYLEVDKIGKIIIETVIIGEQIIEANFKEDPGPQPHVIGGVIDVDDV